MCDQTLSKIPLPCGWAEDVKSAILHVICLAHYATTCARGWAADRINARVGLAGSLGRSCRLGYCRWIAIDTRS